MKRFFDIILCNPGTKIKNISRAICILIVVVGILTGTVTCLFGAYNIITNLTNEQKTAVYAGILTILSGFGSMVLTIPLAWLITIIPYSYGELVENSSYLKQLAKKPDPLPQVTVPVAPQPTSPIQPKPQKKAEPLPQETPVQKPAPQKKAEPLPQETPAQEPKVQKPAMNTPKRDPSIPQKESGWKNHVRFALKYSTDQGMIGYLQSHADLSDIQKLLELPPEQIRAAAIALLENSGSTNA